MKKKICILGSTGSIGKSTLEIISKNRNDFDVILLSGNSNYKLLKEINDVDSIGPIMLGMRKPVHILQLGASVEEIVNMAAVSVVDAQQKEKREETAQK